MREALFRDSFPVQSSLPTLFSSLTWGKKQGGCVLVAQSRVYNTNWGVEPRWILYSFHKIPVEARANMRNNLGPCCTCLLEGGRHDEVPRGGGNKMARVLLTASQGREVATRGVVFLPC